MSSIIRATTTSGLQVAPDNSGSLQLQTNGTTTALTIDTSQNVGIGTTTPASILQVQATTPIITINGTGDNVARGINYQLNGTTYASTTLNTNSGEFAISTGQNGSGFYTTFKTGNGTERMRIEAAGNIRINNSGGLDGQVAVVGTDYAVACANTNTNTPPIYSWNRATSGNNYFMSFYTEATGEIRGSIAYNRATGVTVYNTTSDQRLKENIVDAPSALEKVNSIKIRSFDWKETGFHTDFGVVAQELNEVAPDAVTKGIDDEDPFKNSYWSVDTSVLVPAMIKAIQEQQTIINDLKARIETLEAK